MPQTLNARIVITAIDKASGVFGRIGGAAGKANRSFGSAALLGAPARLFAAAGGIYGLSRAVVSSAETYAKWQSQLEAFGKVVDVQGKRLDAIGDRFRDMAPAVGQSKDAILEAANALAGKGLDLNRTVDSMGAIARVATATGASMEDVANTAFTLIDQLKIAPKDLESAFDKLAAAGKAGGFELKDMAKNLPSLAAQAKLLGFEGEKGAARLAAALQIVMKTAGSTEEAATNMQNLFSKMSAPETQKRLAKFGINYRKEMKKSAAAGEDFFTHMIELIAEKTKGDPLKIGELFPDQQARLALLALTGNLEEFRRVYKQAFDARGVVGRDFDRTLTTAEQRWKRFMSNIDRISTAAGESLWGDGGLGKGLDSINRTLEEISGRQTDALLSQGFAAIGREAAYAQKSMDDFAKAIGQNDFVSLLSATNDQLNELAAAYWRINAAAGAAAKGVHDFVGMYLNFLRGGGLSRGIDTYNWPLRGGSPPSRPRIPSPPPWNGPSTPGAGTGGEWPLRGAPPFRPRLSGMPAIVVASEIVVPPKAWSALMLAATERRMGASGNSDELKRGFHAMSMEGVELPPFAAGSLNQALSGKVEAIVPGPITAELKGQASVNVTVRVDGPGYVAGIRSSASGHLSRPNVGTDNTGRKPGGLLGSI